MRTIVFWSFIILFSSLVYSQTRMDTLIIEELNRFRKNPQIYLDRVYKDYKRVKYLLETYDSVGGGRFKYIRDRNPYRFERKLTEKEIRGFHWYYSSLYRQLKNQKEMGTFQIIAGDCYDTLSKQIDYINYRDLITHYDDNLNTSIDKMGAKKCKKMAEVIYRNKKLFSSGLSDEEIARKIIYNFLVDFLIPDLGHRKILLHDDDDYVARFACPCVKDNVVMIMFIFYETNEDGYDDFVQKELDKHPYSKKMKMRKIWKKL